MKLGGRECVLFLCIFCLMCTLACTNNLGSYPESILVVDKTQETRSMVDSAALVLNADKNTIFQCGYDTIGMVSYDEYYVVESKYLITKKAIEDYRNTPSSRSNTTTRFKLSPHWQKMCFNIAGSMYEKAYMDNAVTLWNGIGDTNLEFQVKDTAEYCGEELFPYEIEVAFATNQIDQAYLFLCAPVLNNETSHHYTKVYINTSNPQWNLVINNTYAQRDYLMAHIIGILAGLEVVETNDGTNPIMLSSDNLTQQYLDNNGGMLWWGISMDEQDKIKELFPPIDHNIPACTFSWENSAVQDNKLVFNTPYTLRITNNVSCCDNILLLKRIKVIDANGVIVSNTLLRGGTTTTTCDIVLPSTGLYTIQYVVYENGISEPMHIENMVVEGINGFSGISLNQIPLSTPYNITYNYYNPDYPNHEVTYELIGEMMFDDGGVENASLIQDGNYCEIVLDKSGAYYVEATVSHNDTVLERHCCNITSLTTPYALTMKMQEIDDVVRDTLPNTPSSASLDEYLIRFHINADVDRFICWIEYETEHHFCRWVPPMRVDKRRDFYVNCVEYKLDNFSSTTDYYLPRAGFWTISYIDALNLETYSQYYTGYIYIPANGMREVESVSVISLPIKEIRDSDIEGRETIRWGENYIFDNII